MKCVIPFLKMKGHFCLHTCIICPWNEETSVYSGTPLFQLPEMKTPNIQWNPSIQTPWHEDTSVYSGTPLFQHPEMRTPLYTVELLYSNPLKWGHLCIQWNTSPEMRTLYTVELLYSNPLKWGHLCIQWNSSIPTPWNEVTSVYSGTPLLKWGHCIQWNSSIPTPWNEDTSVYSGTPLFQHPEIRTPLYTVEPAIPTPWNEDLYTVESLYFNTLKWGHLYIQWNSSIPTPWNEDTSVYSGIPLSQHPETRSCFGNQP